MDLAPLIVECGGKRSATPLSLADQVGVDKPKRRRRCTLPARSIEPMCRHGRSLLRREPHDGLLSIELGMAANRHKRRISIRFLCLLCLVAALHLVRCAAAQSGIQGGLARVRSSPPPPRGAVKIMERSCRRSIPAGACSSALSASAASRAGQSRAATAAGEEGC